MSTPTATSVLTDNPTLTDFAFERPTVDDGADMWRLAKATGVLDLNSSYAYLMWCRDFADTSIVARRDGELAGFVTGFIRPSAPAALMVWQVATAAKFRGQGIAATML